MGMGIVVAEVDMVVKVGILREVSKGFHFRRPNREVLAFAVSLADEFAFATHDQTAPSPPATDGLLTFPTSAMFPPVRAWVGGKKTYASGNLKGGGIGVQ